MFDILKKMGMEKTEKGWEVSGSLDLSGTGIASLPEGLVAGGCLDFRGAGIHGA